MHGTPEVSTLIVLVATRMYLCIIFCSFGLLFGGWGSGCLAWGFSGFGLGTSFGNNSHGIFFHPTECGVFHKKKCFFRLYFSYSQKQNIISILCPKTIPTVQYFPDISIVR